MPQRFNGVDGLAPFSNELRIALRKWQFRQTLDDIETAYHAASRAHAARPDEIEADERAFFNLGPDDQFPERDDNAEFDHIGYRYDQAWEREQQAGRGAHIVRKAFLIALFHHWERYCNARLGRTKYTHPKTMLNELGLSDHARQLLDLERAANCAKHGPGHSCRDLCSTRPELFPFVRDKSKASETELVVDEVTLLEFFALVKRLTA